MLAVHPMQAVFDRAPSSMMSKRYGQMGAGFFEDIFDFVGNAVSGLYNAVINAIDGIIHTVVQIFNTIILVVEACVGQASWDDVWQSLGKSFQLIGNVMVTLNPIRMTQELLLKSNLTASTFRTLDQFTGGILTSATNVSDLVFRAMRGDPISKMELIQDALFILKVVAVVFGGPLALGALIGGMVGNVACKELKDAANTACKVGITIVAAAAASYAADAYGFDWTKPSFEETGVDEFTDGGGTSSQVTAQPVTEPLHPFTDYLDSAGSKTLENKLVDQASLVAVNVCKANEFVGTHECEILGKIGADYVKIGSDKDWIEFLAGEAVKIGAGELMRDWFPKGSPERAAIDRTQKDWDIQIATNPNQTPTIVYGQANTKPLLAVMAVGAGLILVGGS